MLYTLGERKVTLHGTHHYIAPSAIVLGSVVLNADSSVWFNAVLRGDNDTIIVGPNSNIQDGSVLHTDEGVVLSIGADVTIGHMVMLHGCSIGNNTLIGIKAVVLNRASIGNNCLIGANTLIPERKVIPDGSVVVGSPGKIIRTITPEEIASFKWNADHYAANARRYLRELRHDSRWAQSDNESQ